MKKNKKGFMLAETIAVSVTVLGALILIYTQFMNIARSYNTAFSYNTVDKLYAVKNIVDYLEKDGYSALSTNLTDNYIDITTCPATYFTEKVYCQSLFRELGVKTVIFTYEDTEKLRNELNNNNPFSEKFHSFITKFVPDNDNRYRIMVEFNDDTFATLKIGEMPTYTLTMKCINCNFKDSGNNTITYKLMEGDVITFDYSTGTSYVCTNSPNITTMPAADTTITITCSHSGGSI